MALGLEIVFSEQFRGKTKSDLGEESWASQSLLRKLNLLEKLKVCRLRDREAQGEAGTHSRQ